MNRAGVHDRMKYDEPLRSALAHRGDRRLNQEADRAKAKLEERRRNRSDPWRQDSRRRDRERVADRRRMGDALVFAIVLHVLLFILQFDAPGFGSPKIALPNRERRVKAPDLVVLLAASSDTASPTGPPADEKAARPPTLPARREPDAAAAHPIPAGINAGTLPDPIVPAPPPRQAATVQSLPAPVAISRAPKMPRPMPDAVLAVDDPAREPISLPRAEVRPPMDAASAPDQPSSQVQEIALRTAQREAARVEQARLEEQWREETARQDVAREEAEKRAAAAAEVGHQEALRQEAAQQAALASEVARQDAVRKEAERRAAAAAETARQEAFRQDAEQRAAASAAEAARQEAARQEAVQRAAASAAEAARQEIARQDAQRQEVARQQEVQRQAEQRDAARAQAAAREAGDAAAEAARKQSEDSARKKAEDGVRAQQDADSRRPPVSGTALPGAPSRPGASSDETATPPIPAAPGLPAATPAPQVPKPLRSSSAASVPVPANQARRHTIIGRTDRNMDALLYAEGWRQRIELAAPFDKIKEAKANPYTDPIVTVALRSDGSVEAVTFDRPSGSAQMDAAIRAIVMQFAPYRAFPADLARDYDVIEIRRLWTLDLAIRLFAGGR